jgi:hypothetical protein
MRPSRSRLCAAFASLSILAILAACNGKLAGEGGGGTCVDLEPSMFDTSCSSDTDCVSVTLGNVCDGACACGGAAINASDQGKYSQLVSGIQGAGCFCPAMGAPACVGGQCTVGGIGTSGSSSSGGSTGSDDGGSCVTVLPSSLSRACSSASDCTVVTTGTLCSGSCDCGDTPISTSALAQYDAEVSGIAFAACPCAASGMPACVQGACTVCPPGQDCSPPDAGACVNLDPSMFDTSCAQDSDCVDVTLGDLCDDGCFCGGSSINVGDQAEYEKDIANIQMGTCGCPYFGAPLCLGGQCIVCGGAAPPNPACPGPDGGHGGGH